MKILQIPSWYPPNGGEFCRDQAVVLKKSGIDIDVLANVAISWRKYKWKLFTFPRKAFYSEENGVTVLKNYYFKIPKSEKLNMRCWVNKTLHLFDLYVEKQGKPDIIHAHTCTWGGYAAYLIKGKYGIPYVITEHHGMFGHESEYTRNSMKDWYLEYLKKTFSNAAFVLPVGSLQVEKIKKLSSQKTQIQVISNILNTELFTLPPLTTKEEQDTFVFFAANSNNYYKAYDVLLKAFDVLCEENEKVELRIAGGNFDNENFQVLLNECKHRNKIVFCGYLPSVEIRNELWNADALVLPSRAESQSISVLEALATGLPVVCTEVVPPEVVGEKEGYRVPVEDAEALGKAMFKMTKNRNQFDSLAVANHAKEMADTEIFVKQTLSIYKEVLKEL